jgi:hypothetical protein
LPGGTSALRGTRNGNKNTTNVKSDVRRNIIGTAHRPPYTSALIAPNSHLPDFIQNGQSTDEPSDNFVDKTKHSFQDSGNEITKLSQLSANAKTKRVNVSSGASSKIRQRPIEISVKTTALSVGRSQNTVEEASETNEDVTSRHYIDDGDSANTTRQSRTRDGSVHGLNTSKHSARESATRRHQSTRQPESSKQELTRQNIYDLLRRKPTTAKDWKGRVPKIGFSDKGPNKKEHSDSEKGRKGECVNETSDKGEYKTSKLLRETEPADEINSKADSSPCGIRGSAEGTHTECRTQISQDSIDKNGKRVKEISGQKNNLLPDVEGKKELYSARQNRRVALSTSDKTKQVEGSASVKNAGIQRASNGKLETTQDISIEKSKTVCLTEYLAGNKANTEEGSAQQAVGNFATGQKQDTEATDRVTPGRLVTLQQGVGTMSRRPQVLKIKDSATTASRRRDGGNHVSFQLYVTKHTAVL